MIEMASKPCQRCGKLILSRWLCQIKNRRFCGHKCATKTMHETMPQMKNGAKAMHDPKVYADPARAKAISIAKMGKPVQGLRGANHYRWKGGDVRNDRHSDMGRAPYREWRRQVFNRDNFTCQWCGIRGGKLNADHIRPWSLFPEFRYDVSNGRTLCEPCHHKINTRVDKLSRETFIVIEKPSDLRVNLLDVMQEK